MLTVIFGSNHKTVLIYEIYYADKKWAHNYNYWTSGQRINKTEGYHWCLGDKSVQIPVPSPMWADDQPGNSSIGQVCAHLKVRVNQEGVELKGRNCNDTYMFACKVNKIIKSKTGKFCSNTYY